MKVIDLLNKIANGEEVPKKIKVGGYYYEFYERIKNIYDYKQIDIDDGKYFDNYLCDSFFLDDENVLNWEVEVIEEDNKIEKIMYLNNVSNASDLTALSQMQWENNKHIENKINEIIDKINEEK